jgi:tRNA dimethylallyltransferase
VAVVGPTGSGKSEIGLRLAEEFSGEVLNCDSLQVYRHFDVGTAKLRAEQRRGIPHHLLDTREPDQVFTAGEYAVAARAVLQDIVRRKRLPIVVGGTGFYLRALLEGLFPGPARDEKQRQRLAARERRRPGSLHRLLRRFDPQAAQRIHAHDVPKLIRALEVRLLTRRPLTACFEEGRDRLEGFRTLQIGLAPDRQALYQSLEFRLEGMFEGGLLEEVQRILALGYPADIKPFESHGYRQALQMLQGKLTLQEALCQAKKNTRRYAKRQFTWFRHQPGVEWFSGFGDDPEVQRAVTERVREFLENQDLFPGGV